MVWVLADELKKA